MVWVFTVLGLGLIGGGAYAIVDGWPYLVLERGFTQVIAGTVMATGGVILVGLGRLLAELAGLRGLVKNALMAISVATLADERVNESAAAPVVGAGAAPAVATGAALAAAMAGVGAALARRDPVPSAPEPDDPEEEPEARLGAPAGDGGSEAHIGSAWADEDAQALRDLPPNDTDAAVRLPEDTASDDAPEPPRDDAEPPFDIEFDRLLSERLIDDREHRADAGRAMASEEAEQPASADDWLSRYRPARDSWPDPPLPEFAPLEPASDDEAVAGPAQAGRGPFVQEPAGREPAVPGSEADAPETPRQDMEEARLDEALLDEPAPPAARAASESALDWQGARAELDGANRPDQAVPRREGIDAILLPDREPEPEPALDPAPAASEEGVVGAYQVGAAHFTLFSNGSIQARTPEGEFSFASMDELKTYLASEKSRIGA